MKKLILLLSAAVMLVSCGTTGTATQGSAAVSTQSTTQSAKLAGQNSGTALKNLYAQYKTDGTLDFKNINNLLNIASLATSASAIKDNAKNTEFYKNFASGLVIGSMGLVTEEQAPSVIESLTGINLNALAAGATDAAKQKVDVATQTVAESDAVNKVTEAATSLTTLLNMFK